jgi:ribonuclease HI
MELTEEKWCNMHFDGAVSKEGEGAGVSVARPSFEYNSFSFKLYFECTNNVAECKALILGIKMIKKLEIKKVIIYGDLKLVINQVKGVYQAKHPRMRAYRNVVLDLLQDILEYQFVVVPREQNAIADALAVSTSLLKFPIYPNKKYEIEVKHRPAVPDNSKYWQVFEHDK